MTQRILLLLDNKENARLLRERLAARHAAISVSESEWNLDQPVDLIIVDGPTLNRAGEAIQARKQAETPLFLPILLIISRQDAGLQTRQLWQSVDDLITLPVERTELEARIEILLRTRRQSVELQHRSDELAALTEALVQRQKLESIGVLAADRFATSQAPRKSPLQRLQSGSEIMGKGLRTSPALVIRSRLQCRHCPPLLASTATIIPVEIRTLPDRPTLRASSKIGVLQIHITATPNIRQDPFALPFRPPAARLRSVCWHGARAHKPRGVLSCCEGW